MNGTTLSWFKTENERDDSLIWNDRLGMGWVDPKGKQYVLYDETYFKNYMEYENSGIAEKLTKERNDFVDEWYPKDAYLVDIGVGSGYFLKSRPNTFGYDINPVAVEMLKKDGWWLNPYEQMVTAITCWDSIEHIENPSALLKQVSNFVFVSLPIFKDRLHCLKSKHFKPSEHIWYWTDEGFIQYMKEQGFHKVASSTFEIECGREDIHSFAFKR